MRLCLWPNCVNQPHTPLAIANKPHWRRQGVQGQELEFVVYAKQEIASTQVWSRQIETALKTLSSKPPDVHMKLLLSLSFVAAASAFTLPTFLEQYVPTKVKAAMLDPNEIAELKALCRDQESSGCSVDAMDLLTEASQMPWLAPHVKSSAQVESWSVGDALPPRPTQPSHSPRTWPL